MKAYIEAMRSLIYVTAERMDIAISHPDADVRQANQEQVDLLIPICKAWSHRPRRRGHLAGHPGLRRHGLRRGVRASPSTSATPASRPIYEGTNGIQAMDLVGRKLPQRAAAVVEDFLGSIHALDPELAKGGRRPRRRSAPTWPRPPAVLTETTTWLMENGLADVRNALAGATPYLRMFSLVTGGWVMARQALAAQRAARRRHRRRRRCWRPRSSPPGSSPSSCCRRSRGCSRR